MRRSFCLEERIEFRYSVSNPPRTPALKGAITQELINHWNIYLSQRLFAIEIEYRVQLLVLLRALALPSEPVPL